LTSWTPGISSKAKLRGSKEVNTQQVYSSFRIRPTPHSHAFCLLCSSSITV